MATIQEVVAAVTEAQGRIKSGVLADVPSNGHILTAYLMKHNLEPTADNFYKAIAASANSLIWVVKPAQLRAQEHVTIVSSVPALGNEFEARVRAGEKVDADKKEHAALVAQCKSIIETYNPTSRNGYDAREREDMQAHWTKELTKAKEQSVEYMRQFTKGLAAAKAKRYADREKASERL